MSKIAINLKNIGKMYKLYSRPADKILDVLGINSRLFWKKNYYQEFWALREFNLTVKKGERIGIIGRNGAGKSTLLKIICGNVAQTEGIKEVNGNVQALLEIGTGFHPEFTGRENIRSSLAFQRLSPGEIKEKEKEIIDFAEIDDFIDQPIKFYSSGMHARLAFSTATAIDPDLLIIDEVLGAGDAYFSGKCVERMKKLTEDSEATVLFVSHDLNSVQRLCEKSIWIDRGRIVMKDDSLEVIKAYTKYIQDIEDNRLRAKNRKRRSSAYNEMQLDGYGDSLTLYFYFNGTPKQQFDIAEITLFRDDNQEDTLKIGYPQDANLSHSASLILESSNWTKPEKGKNGYYRSLIIPDNDADQMIGLAVFHTYALFDDANYFFRIKYKTRSTGKLSLSIYRKNQPVLNKTILPNFSEWSEYIVSLELINDDPIKHKRKNEENQNIKLESSDKPNNQNQKTRSKSRWPGEGSLIIENVRLFGKEGKEQSVFSFDTSITLVTKILAHKSGYFDFILSSPLYRQDGVLVTKFVSQNIPMHFVAGKTYEFCLDTGRINLGNGYYVFSLAIFEKDISEKYRFDLVDRSYEFKVIGNDQLFEGVIFRQPGTWRLV